MQAPAIKIKRRRKISKTERFISKTINAIEWMLVIAMNVAMTYGTYWLYSSGKLESIVRAVVAQ